MTMSNTKKGKDRNTWGRKTFTYYCKKGDYDTAKQMRLYGTYSEMTQFEMACINGHLEQAKWIYDTSDRNFLTSLPSQRNMIVMACKKGNMEMINWLLEKYPLIEHVNILFDIMKISKYHNIIKLMENNRKFEFTIFGYIDCFNLACSKGYLEIVEWLFQDCKEIFEREDGIYGLESGLIRACTSGHLNIVKWINSITYHQSDIAFKLAAYNGHLHIVKWLYNTHKYEIDGGLLLLIDSRNHFETAKWLYYQKSERFIPTFGNYIAYGDGLYKHNANDFLDKIQREKENYVLEIIEKTKFHPIYKNYLFDKNVFLIEVWSYVFYKN